MDSDDKKRKKSSIENDNDNIRHKNNNDIIKDEEKSDDDDDGSGSSSNNSSSTEDDNKNASYRVIGPGTNNSNSSTNTITDNSSNSTKSSTTTVNPNDGECSSAESPQSQSYHNTTSNNKNSNTINDVPMVIENNNSNINNEKAQITRSMNLVTHYEEQMRKSASAFATAAAGAAWAAAQLASSYSRIGLVDKEVIASDCCDEDGVVDGVVSVEEAYDACCSAEEAVRSINEGVVGSGDGTVKEVHRKHGRQQNQLLQDVTTVERREKSRQVATSVTSKEVAVSLPNKKRQNNRQYEESIPSQQYPPSSPPQPIIPNGQPPQHPSYYNPGPYYSFGSSAFPAPYPQPPYFIPPPPNFMSPLSYPPAIMPFNPYNTPPPPFHTPPPQHILPPNEEEEQQYFQATNKRPLEDGEKRGVLYHSWRNVRQSLPPPKTNPLNHTTGRRRPHSSLNSTTPPPLIIKPHSTPSTTKKRFFKNTPSPPITTTIKPYNFKPIGKTGIAALYELCSKQHWENPKFIELQSPQSFSHSKKLHFREFLFQVEVQNNLSGCGRGGTKSAARQDAARQALMHLLPGISFDSNGIIDSLDKGEDLLPPLLTNQLAIIHSEDNSEELEKQKQNQNQIAPKHNTTSKDDSYYSSPRGASACSTLLHTMCQIDDTILQTPTYTFREVPFVNTDNALRKNNTTSNYKRRLFNTRTRFSFDCTATIIVLHTTQKQQEEGQEESKQLSYNETSSGGNNSNNKRKIIEADTPISSTSTYYNTITTPIIKKTSSPPKKQSLSASGTGSTKRDAKHVASANLLALLFPSAKGTVEVMAAAEAARERYTKNKLAVGIIADVAVKECWYKDIVNFLDIRIEE